MSRKVEQAQKFFRDGFSCSQAVFTPYAVGLGIPKKKALKLSQVLGGGMSHMGLTCGAVTGALLVLSLHFGRSRAKDKAAKELTYELANEFCRRFSDKHGSINCTELIGCSLKTEHGLALANEKGLFEKYCRGYVGDACRLLEGIIREGQKKRLRLRKLKTRKNKKR